MSETGELVDWLQLSRTNGIGPVQFMRLIERHGDAGAALKWLGTPQGLAKSGIQKLFRRNAAIDEVERTQNAGGEFLRSIDRDYPRWLKEIPDPPPILVGLGDLDMLAQPAVAIVGARNASGNGCRLAERLAAEVSESGVTVVSGLARGIDTAAHRGGLRGEGSTIAVIAAGIDIAYPAENRELMERIAQVGLVVSERPFGAAPHARHFPRRNRIISGLSCAVIVVEAAEKSGSLMTARLALEHGREVMAVPGSPMDPRHKGTNRLIRDGAQMVESAEDILASLPEFSLRPAVDRAPPRRSKVKRSAVIKPDRTDAPISQGDLASTLCRLLGAEPLAVDELIRQCHASAGDVQEALLQLEIDGQVCRYPGNRVALELS